MKKEKSKEEQEKDDDKNWAGKGFSRRNSESAPEKNGKKKEDKK